MAPPPPSWSAERAYILGVATLQLLGVTALRTFGSFEPYPAPLWRSEEPVPTYGDIWASLCALLSPEAWIDGVARVCSAAEAFADGHAVFVFALAMDHVWPKGCVG